MAQTTESKVRELSGFDNTTNITPATVTGKITLAEGIVNSAVGRRYALPIPFHRENTITFDGPATGSGTMSIVVNSTNYAITITSGMTAARVAELFRLAAVDSDDFIVHINGAVATLISKTDSTDISTADAEVDVTSVPATEGVTGTIGTRADRYPPLITELAAEIAAALLLMDNYGIESEDTPKDGEKRMTNAMDMLAKIQGSDEAEALISLFDEVTGLELDSGIQDTPSFHPTNTSKTDDDNPTAAKLTINDVW